ncbi:carbohydrate-binding protein CenC [Actinomycetospora sp. NBRC 106378]|uniref:carbohydrate-binding protein CenC n=1 Tax=Actinomycetospora sp. NBRC 106378 TaxID=3032208 RepID=UPI0024A5D128|nr:carbohydrate-binding protein CenC [Actinomycetospora sp. NBRC 106378]GLZ52887.1 hydrolase [Actinomycetospora sp. NBRC 106378]
MIVALRAALAGALLTVLLVVLAILPSPVRTAQSSPTAAGPTSTAPSRPGPRAPDGPLPTVRAAPYVDLTTPPLPDLGAVADASGQRDVVLGFVLAGGGCAPTWGGTTPMTDPAFQRSIAGLTSRGGTVTVSSGGAVGDYLETRCPDAASLARAYGEALDAVGTDHLDVDIETDKGRAVSTARVADALKLLQDERGARITLTVQVESADAGMTDDARDLVETVSARGVAARVNLMVMNFEQRGGWAESMLDAADLSLAALQRLWPGSDPADVAGRVGVTMMIGRNDTAATTTLADAGELVEGARARGYGYVGAWSLMRDDGGCPGTATEADDCSGIAQEPWAFTRVLQRF